MYCPICHERDEVIKLKKNYMCERCKIIFGENIGLTDDKFKLREKIQEKLERVKEFVPIKEWVGDRFSGYNLAVVDKHRDIAAIADCFQAIVDFLDISMGSEGK